MAYPEVSICATRTLLEVPSAVSRQPLAVSLFYSKAPQVAPSVAHKLIADTRHADS
ncbi:MAG: hypothetical protein F6J94_31450 [Moorea sp. SIO1F2]|uniref:hypothetical protein n=1 Tax=unclassified Moorena TaxID=2683338 RepID=UPI0013BBC441|nr:MULTISPECIES: hypothetical protein [unclassified Moorena]NEO11194.1 hypothetical protein [Moorena sp. SIO3E8]NEP29779.1 hypothetical protein [Moorena sp. SIO3I6]NEQ00129.1 hypothetical protein [Moorena sp. SIO3F7]NEQ63700.1 hypothetical protein [Moorena sp. SIO4A1]NET86227.1 hypothetical protein [Moorena sp. SIO1F2]